MSQPPPQDESNKHILFGVLGIVSTVLLAKGCDIQIDCLGCVQPPITDIVSKPVEPTPSPATTVKDTYDCTFIDINPPPNTPRLGPPTPEMVDNPSVLNKRLREHILAQNKYLAEYRQVVEAATSTHNENCK